jgi:hypothetical protein
MSQTSVQTAVAQTGVIGVPGDAYDASPTDRVTKIATAAVAFGTWVDFHTEDKGQNPVTTGAVTALPHGGIAMRDPNLASASGGYAIGDAMTVMVRGRAFVVTEETVVVTDTPFVRFATGTVTTLGGFRNDADTATCVAAPNAKFFKGGGTTAPAVVELY